MNKDAEVILDLKGVADLLLLNNEQSIYVLVRDKGLPAHKVAGKLRFLRCEVMDWVRKQPRRANQKGTEKEDISSI